jgi:proline iminopeptidase
MNKTKKNNNNNNKTKNMRKKYTKLKPYSTDSIQVSDIHNVFFYQYGNPMGIPVFFIHGGPGDFSNPKVISLFNTNKYRIIMIDQRGCGKSTPFCETKENTTDNLVDDMHVIREYLSLHDKKIILFGVSWGTFLALSYAIKYPSDIKRIILRSVFLCSQNEFNDIENGDFVKKILPDVYDDYIKNIKNIKRPMKEVYNKINNNSQSYLSKMYHYEKAQLNLVPNITKRSNKTVKKYTCAAKMQSHYFSNKCFSTNILSKMNLIQHIPVTIVHGRYDLSTPAYYAYLLHKSLPKSQIFFTIAGHSMTDKENWNKLTSIFK